MRRAAQMTERSAAAPPNAPPAPPAAPPTPPTAPPPDPVPAAPPVPTPVPPPRQVTPQIPVLASAPPSANLPPKDEFDALWDDDDDDDESVAAAPVVLATPAPLPPPPAMTTTTKTISPVLAPLPPPPRVAPSLTKVAPPLPPPPTMVPLPPPPPVVTKAAAPLPPPPPVVTTLPVAPPPSAKVYPPPPPPAALAPASPSTMRLLARRQTHIPILIIASEASHHVAWKNGVTLPALLTGLVGGTTAAHTLPPFRSVTRALPLQWEHVTQVEFVTQVATPLADEAAVTALHAGAALQPADGNLEQELNLLEDQVDNLLPDERNVDNSNLMDWHEARQGQLEQVTKDAFGLTSPLTIPWLWRYRLALDASTDGLPHDLLACPPLCLLVCTTQEATDPIEVLRNLESPHYLPPQFANGLWDARYLRKEVLVLHDNVEGPSTLDEALLMRSLRTNFGASSTILRINSISRETATQLAQEEASDLWGGGGTLGNCLSVSDRVKLRQYLSNLLIHSLLPAMERRIAELNMIVSDRKKGVRNVLKSFWRTGKKDEEAERADQVAASAAAAAKGTIVYRCDTIESQTRLLADSLFLMRDYEAAYSTYRLIRDDYKQDKAMVHYGSCQEMMAVCLHFMDPYGRSREMFGNIENALLSYNKSADEERTKVASQGGRPTAAPPSTRLATRLCLVMIFSRHISAGRHLEVADLLASASAHETPLGAAVLLEQASAHYFRNDMYRKYSFHMLMSGHMFRAAGQEHHAFRCFTSALCIYRDGRWEELHNHVRSALAAQLYSMGRMSIALQLYAKLLGSANGGRVSVKSQQKFVTHLLDICNEHPKKALAGADRMAVASTLSGGERDQVRKDRFERIVQVIRYTKSASRVLELPYMDLPLVDDSTITVIAEEGARVNTPDVHSIGISRRGSPEVWEQLTLEATAELVARHTDGSGNDEMTSNLLSRIEDGDIRRVVAEIDKDKARRAMAERTKRSANYKPSPPVRALKEPFAVEFLIKNPLGIPVDLYDIQLVIRMTNKNDHICTNEDAIKIRPLKDYDKGSAWTFQNPDVTFSAADFCRVSTESAGSSKQRWKSTNDVDPFFVVTKETLSMEPESTRTVSLGLCPLVQGDIEIVGMRCRIFDDIWVFHPFTLKGELLQNTRSNRANRVRGESLLLKAKVREGMPCLTADILSTVIADDDSGSSIFQGQISKWNLRLSNVGTAPARNVVLKSNYPWLTMWNGGNPAEATASTETLENQPVPFVMSPSGTLMRVPIDDLGLKVDGEIQPGESVDVEVDIRASRSGKRELYLLFRYDLALGDEHSHRWLRKMFEIPVYPSIECQSAVMPSFAALGEHVLSLEVSNLRNDKPDGLGLQVDSITLASRSYSIEPILPSNEVGARREVYLGWQDRLSLHYKITGPFEEDAPCHLNKDDLVVGENGLITRELASESTKLDFLRLERAHGTFRQIVSAHQKALARAALEEEQDEHPRSIAEIRRANTSATSDSESDSHQNTPHGTSISKLAPKALSDSSSVLMCTWGSPDGLVSGVHFISSISVRPPTKACPIAITARHPELVAGNLAAGPASVPFEVTLRNRFVNETVTFEFVAETQSNMDMMGASTFESFLQGGEDMTVNLVALVNNSGIYNLQNVRIIIKNDEPESFLFPVQWMVTVVDESE